MKILLLGADGQLGRELRSSLSPHGEITALGDESDITDADAMQGVVRGLRPDAIVNAAAYTAVDRAETEARRAHAVNADACAVLARQAEATGAWLVHYSTDYVFDGAGNRPWRESDEAAPLGVYGATKLAGEQAIRAGCERHVILRTSWVYEAGRSNFIGAILKAACARDSLTVVDDQWGAPTRARDIAQATAAILPGLQARHAGLYHFAAAGETNRFALARFAIERAAEAGWPIRARGDALRRASTAEMPSPARRPLNSRLDCGLFDATFGVARAPWPGQVSGAIAEWPVMGDS